MLAVTALAVVLALPQPQPPRPAAPPARSTASAPLSQDELRARVRTLLSSIDRPARPSDWLALGPAAVPVLLEVVRDPAQLPSRRSQALFGLGAIGGPQARAELLATARNEHEPLSVRAAALEGLPRVLAPGELVPAVGPVLHGARSTTVRAVAAEVLARSAPAAGCVEVRSQLEREPADARGQFHRATERCTGRTPAEP